jgi:hypothetical protein
MALDLKSRMVSFRLTADEYERVRELCYSHGLPSVSEMARTAIHLLLNNLSTLPAQSLEGRLTELEGRVRTLASDVRKLQSRTAVGGQAD